MADRFESNLDLHEAMVLVLLERKHNTGIAEALASELSAEIARRELYLQGSKAVADAGIMASRAVQYPGFFEDPRGASPVLIRLKKLKQSGRASIDA